MLHYCKIILFVSKRVFFGTLCTFITRHLQRKHFPVINKQRAHLASNLESNKSFEIILIYLNTKISKSSRTSPLAMPPAPKRRTAMSMRNILNPTQEGSDLQRPHSIISRQNQQSQQDPGSGIPAHDPGDDSKPNTQSAVTGEDDINIRGQAGRHPFTDRSQTYRANDPTSGTSNALQNDRTSDMSGSGVLTQMSTLEVLRTPERGSMLPKSFQRRESTGSEPMKLSDDESSDENMLSDHSADDEPSQRSPWSSQGQQYSSQSTVQSNRHEDIEEHHGSSMETVLQSSQRTFQTYNAVRIAVFQSRATKWNSSFSETSTSLSQP